MDRPPAYSEKDETFSAADIKYKSKAQVKVSSGSQSASYNYGVYCSGPSLDVRHGNRNICHAAFSHRSDRPNIRLYGGYDSNGPQLALSKFSHNGGDIQIHLSGDPSPGERDWTLVQAIRESKLSPSPSYRFEVQAPRDCNDDPSMKRLRWQKSRIGKRRFLAGDFDLIDEANGEVVASYHDREPYTDRSLIGNVTMHGDLEEQAQTAALLVLFSILDRVNRYMIVMIRAFPASH